MFKFDPNKRYLMPANFGPRPTGKGTAHYHDVTTIVITYRTDREKLAAYLPEPFEVGKEPFVYVSYAMCKQVDWLAGHSYNLIGVNASAVFKGAVDGEGGYAWGGAAGTQFWVDSKDDMLGVFMVQTQRYRSPVYPEFRKLAYQASTE